MKFDKMGQRYDQDLELRVEIVEKYRTRQQFDEDFLPLKRFHGVSFVLNQPTAELAPISKSWRSPHSRLNSPPLPYLLLWLRSGKNLDLCLLALCSCILSLLCHQTVSSLPASPSLANSSAPISSSAGLSGIDLVIKAGLFTTSSETKEETEQSLE